MSHADLHPPKVQRYVVEHIVKSDDSAMNSSTQRLRAFSGRSPRPQTESDYDTWRSGVELLLQDPAVSDLQRSRKIFDSLLPPAADMVKHLRPDTSPTVYLQTLDSAYGTVQDGDELYAKFMDTFQDAGEKSSSYLQRLQVALNLAVKRGGVATRDFDRHLLTQFCRGCWDNSLITELQLKQRKQNPPSFAELLLLLRTEEDREAAKAVRMKQHLGSSRPRAAAYAQYAYADNAEKNDIAALTNVTQQLAQQLADIQKQLATLTAAQSSSSSAALKSTPRRMSGAGQRAGKPIKNPASVPKPGYCYRCGEDGHVKTHCDNPPNSALVAHKKKQFAEKQQKWQRSNPTSRNPLN
uniref:CCHC-type domain-containing protein n=1 Tax=Amphiprion percula TaxID=161767 RepID=A0A3P8SMC1_AMPPE